MSTSLGKRFQGALIYGAFIGLTFGMNRFSFLTGSFVLLLLAIYEAHQLISSAQKKSSSTPASYVLALLVSGFMLFCSLSLSFAWAIQVLLWIACLHHIYLVVGYSIHKLRWWNFLPVPIATSLYVGLSFGALYTYSISLFVYEKEVVWLILFVVWATDIGAYFTGKKFGRHSLAPMVSPNKTWEGVLGGILFGVSLSIVLSYLFDLSIQSSIRLGCITSCATILGDLAESGLKRKANLKDSGTLLPGHGGILDRIDGYMYAQAFIALYCSFVPLS